MKNIISITEVVEAALSWEGTWEVIASAEAQYDEAAQQLIVQLDSLVRPYKTGAPLSGFSQSWLPPKQTVHESAPLEDALPLAKDIFHGWVRRVRSSLPNHPPP